MLLHVHTKQQKEESFSLYIHIPFCRKRCTYCDFHFSTYLGDQRMLVQALIGELILRKEEQESFGRISTLYLGGGTPSILDVPLLQELFDGLHKHVLGFERASEITLEVNPEDMSYERMKAWKELGINRLSIGIQSLDDKQLKWMNRGHTAQEAIKALERTAQLDFKNVSVDYIFGLPQVGTKQAEKEIQQLCSFDITHLSAYSLTVERRTVLYHQTQRGIIRIPPEFDFAEQFLHIDVLLCQHGYEHYEISNYAKGLNQRSQHNSLYWSGKPYMGIGPAAHSYDGNGIRSHNIENNTIYIESIGRETLPREIEHLSEANKWNEFVMTNLRKKEGISFHDVAQRWGVKKAEYLKQVAASIPQYATYISVTHDCICFTIQGWLFCDSLASKFFI